jgi:hypothetical protein
MKVSKSIQRPSGKFLFREKRTGVHWKITVNVTAVNQQMAKTVMDRTATWKPSKGTKVRRKINRVEYLMERMTTL